MVYVEAYETIISASVQSYVIDVFGTMFSPTHPAEQRIILNVETFVYRWENGLPCY